MRYLDVLALLGEGSAHPGGFATTLGILSSLELRKGMRVLEVGCGTGRTACYTAEAYGCSVVGVDRHPLMIEKAKKRAETTQGEVQFIQGSAEQLPFADATFDLVLIESVTLFTNREAAIEEYRRVLKPGGMVVDLEIYGRKPLPASLTEELLGITEVPTWEQWKGLFTHQDFRHVSVDSTDSFQLEQMARSELEHPDSGRVLSSAALAEPEVIRVFQLYAEFMEEHASDMGQIIIRATK